MRYNIHESTNFFFFSIGSMMLFFCLFVYKHIFLSLWGTGKYRFFNEKLDKILQIERTSELTQTTLWTT